MKRSLGVVVLAASLGGCGGGSASVQPAAVPAQANAGGSAASIETTIVVPGATTQSDRRYAQYVSASTLSLKAVVTDIPPTGGTASFTATTTVYALQPGINKIVVPTPASAPGHSEDITYVAYDAAPVANAIPTSAKAVGWGITTGFVVVPGQNTNNVVLAGVVDGFPAPLTESGSFGMMSAAPPVLAGAQASLGFGGAAVPSGIATVIDGGGDNITTAAGGPWPLVGAVPSVATTIATGVPVTISETAGTCGSSGTSPHLKLSYANGVPATSAALTSTSGALVADYDGGGGAGWYAIITAKGVTQSLIDTLSSLAVTSTNTQDFSCANQTVLFSSSNETVPMTIVQHGAAKPYTITVPNTANCTQLVNVYAGNSPPANPIPYGVPTSLGAGTTFTLQAIPSNPAAPACNIEIADANAANTGGAAFPGATTYMAVLPEGSTLEIIVP